MPRHKLPPGPGRPKGVPNKLTTAFRDAVLTAYRGIGGDKAFTRWARANPTLFYQIAARLIPHEVVGPGEGGAHLVKNIVHIHEFVADPMKAQ